MLLVATMKMGKHGIGTWLCICIYECALLHTYVIQNHAYEVFSFIHDNHVPFHPCHHIVHATLRAPYSKTIRSTKVCSLNFLREPIKNVRDVPLKGRLFHFEVFYLRPLMQFASFFGACPFLLRFKKFFQIDCFQLQLMCKLFQKKSFEIAVVVKMTKWNPDHTVCILELGVQGRRAQLK